jgi:copper chaperone
MEQTIINVEGMSCEHCVAAVTNAVSALPGASRVAVDLAAKTVTVHFDPALVTADQIADTIEDQGYDVVK